MRTFVRAAKPKITYRRAEAEDLDACADVLYEADDALSVSRGLPLSPRNREALVRLFAHMHAQYPDRWHVAEHDGRIIGFGGSAAYDELCYLGFLFVVPDLQAAGTGRRLLELSMHHSAYRAVCIASYQPVSAALYARYGMVPRVPLYMLTGLPTRPLPALSRGLDVHRVAADAVERLDLEVCGLRRPHDHSWWEAMGRVRFGLFDRADLIGYGYVQAVGRLGPFVVRRGEHLLPFVGRLMAEVPADAWMINVPGPASETFQGLLEAGLRLEGPPAIFCATDLHIDHTRYLPASYALP